MTASTTPPHIVDLEHRGWKLQARWLSALSSTTGGWVCYATRPAASQGLNIGRWHSSELALEHGRAHVDRSVDAPAPTGRRPPVLRRRQ